MPEEFQHFAENYSVLMGLVNFIPVILFAVAGCIMIKSLFNNLKKPFAVMFCSGVTLGLTAGVFKALWKILVALNICDFYPLNFMFLPTESLGFVLMGIGLISILFDQSHHHNHVIKTNMFILPVLLIVYEASPVKLFDGSIIFIIMLIIGEALIATSMCYLSMKNKKWYCLILFVVSFIAAMVMGAMKPIARKMDVTLANWIEESVNLVAQACLLIGCILLNKEGFFSFKKVEKKENHQSD